MIHAVICLKAVQAPITKIRFIVGKDFLEDLCPETAFKTFFKNIFSMESLLNFKIFDPVVFRTTQKLNAFSSKSFFIKFVLRIWSASIVFTQFVNF